MFGIPDVISEIIIVRVQLGFIDMLWQQGTLRNALNVQQTTLSISNHRNVASSDREPKRCTQALVIKDVCATESTRALICSKDPQASLTWYQVERISNFPLHLIKHVRTLTHKSSNFFGMDSLLIDGSFSTN